MEGWVAFQVCESPSSGCAHLGKDGRRRTADGRFSAFIGGPSSESLQIAVVAHQGIVSEVNSPIFDTPTGGPVQFGDWALSWYNHCMCGHMCKPRWARFTASLCSGVDRHRCFALLWSNLVGMRARQAAKNYKYWCNDRYNLRIILQARSPRAGGAKIGTHTVEVRPKVGSRSFCPHLFLLASPLHVLCSKHFRP